jgi:hypothetical protein
LERSARPYGNDQHLKHARTSLPSDWEAYEALEGRILYIHKLAAGAISTSWQHLNASFAPLVNVVRRKAVLGQGVDYEALICGFEDNPLDAAIQVVV